MSPCCYVNDAATNDIRSLLLMKRKNGKDGGAGSTTGKGGNEQLRVVVDVEDDEDRLVRLPRFAKANDG